MPLIKTFLGCLRCHRIILEKRIIVHAAQKFHLDHSRRSESKSYKLLVVGGGCGGTATVNMFASKLGPGNVAVIEPNETHYYQPLFTLVGGGIRKFEDSSRKTADLLSKSAVWIKDRAAVFDPLKCTVLTEGGSLIKYDYLVMALGLQLNYHLVKGLPEALETDPSVCSNYWSKTVVKTYPAIRVFEGGNAIFTFPNTPIKCAGAPQKIMYLAEEYFAQNGKRAKANVMFNTSLGVIFAVKKYADALLKVVAERKINVNYKHSLIEVRADKKEAVFELLDTKEKVIFPYSFLHVTPPMSAPEVLKKSPLVNEAGFVSVNRQTLQHTKYPNVFAIGDCSDVPTSKTAAAIASQTGALGENLDAVMNGRQLGKVKYDGYTSCPLVTGRGKCILAEFDWDAQPLETFPFDQGTERRSMYHLKRDVFPQMYWHMLTQGSWHGPGTVRKVLHLGRGR